MKKTIFTLLIFFQTFFHYSQKIGIIESYNPNFKHAHLKGFFNMKLNSVEDLNYNIKPFIDSLFVENKITPIKIENFDTILFEDSDAINNNNKIEKNLEIMCKENNYEAIIIVKNLGNKHNKLNLLASDLNPELDFGLVSFENPKKSLFYYNNIIFLYYTIANNKLKYTIRKRRESLFYDLNPIRFEEIVFSV
jgi:hypothetical protein